MSMNIACKKEASRAASAARRAARLRSKVPLTCSACHAQAQKIAARRRLTEVEASLSAFSAAGRRQRTGLWPRAVNLEIYLRREDLRLQVNIANLPLAGDWLESQCRRRFE